MTDQPLSDSHVLNRLNLLASDPASPRFSFLSTHIDGQKDRETTFPITLSILRSEVPLAGC